MFAAKPRMKRDTAFKRIKKIGKYITTDKIWQVYWLRNRLGKKYWPIISLRSLIDVCPVCRKIYKKSRCIQKKCRACHAPDLNLPTPMHL